MGDLLRKKIDPNWEGLVKCVRREGTPDRVYHIELLLDKEVKAVLCERFDLLEGVDPDGEFFHQEREMRLYQRCREH